MEPQRIVVIGNSGAGKSHLATAHADRHGVAHLDLDTLVWEPDRIAVQRPIEAVTADLERFVASHPGWVAEGCYGELAAVLDDGAVALWWLDPGVEVCVSHCQARPWEPHKYPSKEAQDERLPMLLDWVRGYETREDAWSRHGHQRVYDGWSGPKRVLTTNATATA